MASTGGRLGGQMLGGHLSGHHTTSLGYKWANCPEDCFTRPYKSRTVEKAVLTEGKVDLTAERDTAETG